MSKSRKSEHKKSSKMVSTDRKSVKTLFKIVQNVLKLTFDREDIIFHHSDHLKAKVERDEPIQVIRMVMCCFIYFFISHMSILMT